MAKDNSTLIGLGLAAAVGYYGYTKGWFASLLNSSGGAAGKSSASGDTPAGGGAPPPASSSSSASAPPPYKGASLDQMFQLLQESVQAAYGTDPHLSCAGLAGFGLVPGHSSTQTPPPPPAIGRVGYQIDPNAGGMALRPVGGIPSARPAVASSTCANPIATYDVFNWYLTNRAGGPVGPNPPDHTTLVSLTDYWTWAAPLLKQAVPGLAGGFNGGLGGYAELGMILERQAGGF